MSAQAAADIGDEDLFARSTSVCCRQETSDAYLSFDTFFKIGFKMEKLRHAGAPTGALSVVIVKPTPGVWLRMA